MDSVFDLLSRAGVLPSKDLPALRESLMAKAGESPAEQAHRIVAALKERYALTAEQLAEFMVKAQLEGGHALKVLTPSIRIRMFPAISGPFRLNYTAEPRRQGADRLAYMKNGA